MLRCSKLMALRGLRTPDFILSSISRMIVSNSKTSDSALLTRSSILDFYGMKLLSVFNSQFPLQRTNRGKLNTKRQITEENFTVALCHLAMHFGSISCHNEATAILNFLQTQHECYSRYLPLVKESRLRLDFSRYINERNLIKAKHVADFFIVFDKDESSYMHAVIDAILGNHTKAYQRAMTLNQELSSHEKRTVPQLKIRIRLLLIELKLLSQDSTSCIEDILELVTVLKELKTTSFLIEVQSCLIRYKMKFGLFDRALKLIDDVFITGFTNGNPYQLGCLYFLQARATTSKLDSESEKDPENYETVLTLYDRSFTFFEKAGAKARISDVYYERSLVYHRMGLSQERNTAATHFRLLNEELNGFWNETFLF
ncbi:anaphase-promoting complex subunit 5-like [Clytia hemisphaerica]|uniref:anaphase-promoting complex subunit 5-like n=1 Tax=Clytia hemisphaerica TaxID=252671 RepID=UPI0034D7974A